MEQQLKTHKSHIDQSAKEEKSYEWVCFCVHVQWVPVHAPPASLQPFTCSRHTNRRGWWEGKELCQTKQSWNCIPALNIHTTVTAILNPSVVTLLKKKKTLAKASRIS